MEPSVVYSKLLELQQRILDGQKGPAYVTLDDVQTLSAAMAIVEAHVRLVQR